MIHAASALCPVSARSRFALLSIVGILAACPAADRACGEEPAPQHVRNQLLEYRDASGQKQKVTTRQDWHRRRESILQGAEAAMGPLPRRDALPPLQVEVIERQRRPRHQRQTVRFTTEPGERWSAYVWVPHGIRPRQRRAGILALHPTHRIGKGVVDGQSERSNRAYGRELADRGYVVVAPDYPSFGDAADYDFANDKYVSGTMKAIWVHMRAVDLLSQRSDVDAERIGAIGHSLGGHNAIFAGVFDQRIKAVVTSCGWCPFHDYYGGKIKGWTSDRYMPLLATKYQLDPNRVPFDFYELVAALAPRGFFTCSPTGDHNFDVTGVRKAMPVVRQVYERFDATERLRAVYPEAGHDFPPSARRQAYAFLDDVLQHDPDDRAKLPDSPR